MNERGLVELMESAKNKRIALLEPSGRRKYLPRGSRTGTQGIIGAAERSKIPYKLALSFAKACEEGR